ncbi:MAG TPA: hypothetical protein VIY29_12980, partial [Ktedonobacteraceae bacterium]
MSGRDRTTRNERPSDASCGKAGDDRTDQATGTWRSERKVPTLPELSRHGEEHTSHCSLFTFGLVGKTSGEAMVEL